MPAEPSISAACRRERFYDTIADTFDEVMNPYDISRRLSVVFEELLGSVNWPGTLVLDAGCGTGRFSAEAARRGARVVSVDIGPRLLRVARGRCGTHAVCADIARLAVPDDTFDVVISSECIEHTPDPAQAVAELLRVCKPGGLVAVTCPNAFWHWSCVVADRLGLRPYEGLENWPGWFELRRWVCGAGGRPLVHRGIHLFPFVVRRLQPLLRKLDGWGERFGWAYVNQAILAVKTAT